MIAAWMIFGFVVTLLLAVAGVLGERAAREVGWNGLRWIWTAAMGGAFLLLVAAVVASRMPGPEAGPPAGPETVIPLDAAALEPAGPVLLAVAEGGWLDRMDWLAMALWIALTLLLAVRSGIDVFRLRRRARVWPEVVLPEGRVLVSQDTGPALMGLFRWQVVVPRWCLELDSLRRELILAHEIEHARSRDTVLLTGAWALLMLFPWNLPFWWMYRRLREAVELDCDSRVARRYPDRRRSYGELLLMVGGRRAGPGPLPLTTFSERSSTLGRRIDMLTRTPNTLSRPRTLLLAGGGLLLVAGACLLPGPDRTDSLMGPDDDASPGTAASLHADVDPADGPTFTPFTVAPEVINRAEIGRALEAEYPPLLRDAGVGGTTLLHFFIDAEGVLRDARLAEGSGHPALDQAALRVAPHFRFTPALNRMDPVPVWIQIPITFNTRTGDESAERPNDPGDREAAIQSRSTTADAESEETPLDREAVSATPLSEVEAGPTFTPFTVAPEVLNRVAIRETVATEYPALLREAGVGGRVLVHILLDESGTVRDAQLADGSGHAALDDAAIRVARTMEFRPAENQGQPVPVWIQLPLEFQPE